MLRLRGNSPATVDEKGRLKLPTTFKADLDTLATGEGQGNVRHYLTSLDGKSARLYPMPVWEALEARLAQLPSTNPARRKLLEFTAYYGSEVEPDAQGRFVIPPILREAAQLTGEVAVSNAAFALASGVPSLVPFLGIPISAADTIILTKSQALMVYRLALACGAPPEFQKRMLEITPVIGGAVVWRQIAGALVGLVPGYGIVPKTAVAFGGTYVVGLAATRWYETGLLTDLGSAERYDRFSRGLVKNKH